MDAEDQAASKGSYQVKVVGDCEVSIAHIYSRMHQLLFCLC